MSSIIKNKILPVIFAGLLFALILISACTDTSQPPVSPTPGQSPDVPVTPRTSETPGASVTTEIPATTITAGKPSCPSGQTLCDGSCIDTQSDSQHCGACGHICNTSEPCSEGKCLSWTGSWWIDDGQRTFELTQTGTSVNGFDSTFNQIIISGSTSGNPPKLTGIWTYPKSGDSSPCTFDMTSDGKSFTGGLLGKRVLTWIRVQE
ncbi:Stigma-specific protein, Stig1 [Methanoregula formicica SMSP]|uniref:Stigma-specific protein, Stig1 n=1 Tax=Methanoregula formicica (strain DSM 22288 / NBRC 105244 / SMSP) TaxID=593750 RepID=L0HJ17_METFS|nr:Stigma-specific protein, Stig1 [Methanoregula formicica SMSP]